MSAQERILQSPRAFEKVRFFPEGTMMHVEQVKFNPLPPHRRVFAVHNQEGAPSMMKLARELAGRGHRLQMIEAVLAVNGFREASEFLARSNIGRELRNIADRARRRDESERRIREPAVSLIYV
jgi:hypothetical protein